MTRHSGHLCTSCSGFWQPMTLATSTVTKALAMLWSLSGESSFGACLAELFITHESLVLLAMTVDCYVVACQPLCYRALLTQHVLISSMPGTVDEDGICHYMVHLLNSSTTLKQLKQLQSTAQELMSKYEQELSRVSEYARAIEDQDSQVLEINDSPNSRDPTALASSYESPVFNLLRLELEGAQELVAQLKAKKELVANASLTLKLLADSDQCSFHCLCQEVDVLKGQLRECEREKEQEEASTHCHPPLPLGSCAHGGLQKVSRPIVVQLNWRGFSYKAGTWGRDSAPNPASSLYWVAPLREDGR
ncbi:Olfactomedin-4 [Pteropus alecto]|uniref:Olfactomedin-4 n=1 Tax=Pteropus alecto TaxID=9402 RepID=L5KCK6_PTEAL|nr:Olfactomedin-4 [Pteropus alecto]